MIIHKFDTATPFNSYRKIKQQQTPKKPEYLTFKTNILKNTMQHMSLCVILLCKLTEIKPSQYHGTAKIAAKKGHVIKSATKLRTFTIWYKVYTWKPTCKRYKVRHIYIYRIVFRETTRMLKSAVYIYSAQSETSAICQDFNIRFWRVEIVCC